MKNPEIDKWGTKQWYNEMGQLHRLDGPALILFDGTIGWFQNDKCHRTDGPAIIREDGTEEWWINGKHVVPIPNIICLLRKKLHEES